ncbi:MAG: sulfotransferase [Gammaproteobacteria bacterium]|nr:sulfotransferase [Gammaproteobacteria bacterium]MDH4254093.1 sulfotransferase [Gammaproteobacteria bacterium]MDH5309635.1 sulfotransferase [Gammaproteobacteria bacterium]MDH5500470.1 sulfotransferase [Gammaproteobacteria bacterium]
MLRRLAKSALGAANRIGGLIDPVAASRRSCDAEPIFIVGLPRSGTTLLYELIVQAFNVAYLTKSYSYTYGLPNISTRLIAPAIRRPKASYVSKYGRIPGLLAPAENHVVWQKWFRETGELGHYVAPELISPDDAFEVNDMVRSLSAIAGRQYVFKNVYFSLSIAALMQTITNARIVLIMRDSAAVAASLIRAGLERRSADWWSVRPPFYREWLDRDLCERVAYQTIRTEQMVEHDLARLMPGRHIVVRYEQLCRDPRKFIEEFHDWAGDTLSLRQHGNVPAAFVAQPSAALPEDMSHRFLAVAGELQMTREDYLARVDAHVEQIAAR